MPTIRYSTSGKEHEFPDGDEVNVLRVSIRYDCGLPFKCASGNCGTDRIYVVEGRENLSRVRPKEYERLGEDLVEEGYRLACQTYASGDVSVVWDPEQKALMPDQKAERLKEYWLAKHDTE